MKKETKTVKKVKKLKEDEVVSTVTEEKTTITLLPVDFGREDLNLIAQKVNELILLSK